MISETAEKICGAIGQLSSVVEDLRIEIADMHKTIHKGLCVEIDNPQNLGLDVNIINDVWVKSADRQKILKTTHSAGCAITKVGTDDPDCTCGLQEVLDDEARDLAEEESQENEQEDKEHANH